MASQNFLNSEFWSVFFGTFGMEIKVCKNGEVVRDVIAIPVVVLLSIIFVYI